MDSVSATPVITNVTDNVGNAATTVVSGELTNDATPTLSGTADANSVVTIFDGGTQIAVVTADNTGTGRLLLIPPSAKARTASPSGRPTRRATSARSPPLERGG